MTANAGRLARPGGGGAAECRHERGSRIGDGEATVGVCCRGADIRQRHKDGAQQREGHLSYGPRPLVAPRAEPEKAKPLGLAVIVVLPGRPALPKTLFTVPAVMPSFSDRFSGRSQRSS